MADENFGVIRDDETLTHHAIARRFGVADSKNRCSQFVLNNLFKAGLPFRRVGKFYVVDGLTFKLWVQEGLEQWDGPSEDTKLSGDSDESVLSADGGTKLPTNGEKKRSRRNEGETPSC